MMADYTARLTGWLRVEMRVFATEEALLAGLPQRSRLVLLDENGRVFSSEAFAAWLGRERESAVSSLTLAIGPADGWSEAARSRAAGLISLSPLTLPHELARVVAAEQLYRAWAILERHPYHRP